MTRWVRAIGRVEGLGILPLYPLQQLLTIIVESLDAAMLAGEGPTERPKLHLQASQTRRNNVHASIIHGASVGKALEPLEDRRPPRDVSHSA